MTDSLFDQNDNNTNSNADREALMLKWKDKSPEEVLRAKIEADLTIAQRNREMDELRSDYLTLREQATAQAKLQDLIDRLENPKEPIQAQPTLRDEEKKPTFELDDIDSLISKRIQETELNKKATENFNLVQKSLKDNLGDNYSQILKERMNTLGLTEEDVNTWARKSPAALLNALGVSSQERKETFQNPPRSDRRSDTFAPKTEKRTWSWWQNLRHTNPKEYFDPKNSVQRLRDSEELGLEFQDGDFNTMN